MSALGITVLVFALTICSAKGTSLTADTRWPSLDVLKPTASPDVQQATVTGMLLRLLRERADEFVILVDPNLGPQDKDTYRLEDAVNGTIAVIGSSGVAAALGIHNYLKQWCGCHVSWSGNQLKVPKPLPILGKTIQVTTQDRFRYYQNVCTVSYSSVWWQWARWEQEIDWMALNGINLPLAFTGQEAIWWRVYKSFGFSDKEIQDFFSGSAFFAWQRMGNLDGWGGPLSQNLANNQLALQHKILDRMRDFGIIPVLPAFSGHVPKSITQRFPSVKVTHLPKWNSFGANYSTILLDPTEPLFQQISNSFMNEMKKEFGLTHIYNTDVFNEMTPTSSDPQYLKAVGAAIFKGMTVTDPDAIWLMQGWLFNDPFWRPAQAKALITSVPIGKMIILDLQAELTPMYSRYESFYGQPFIWCMLHNFGGVLGMYGAIQNVNALPFKGRAYPNSTMVGTGLTMEGIFQNDVMYEFMNEIAWRPSPVNLKEWFTNYSLRRYGSYQQNAAKAWNILKSSVYNCTDGYKHHGGYVIVKKPSLRLSPILWYRSQDLLTAWDLLLNSSSSLDGSSTYRYDLTDVTREVLQTLANQLYFGLTNAFNSKNLSELQVQGSRLLDLLNDMETLLAADEHFLLGHWLEDAKALTDIEDEKHLLEYNARNQITLWGPSSNILDYAAKQWSGLFKSYYIPRWKLFINMLTHSLETKTPFKQNDFDEAVFTEVEQPFTFDRSTYPTFPTGHTIAIAQHLHNKWRKATNKKLLRRAAKKYRARILKSRWSQITSTYMSSLDQLDIFSTRN